jgi:hypothetical protein
MKIDTRELTNLGESFTAGAGRLGASTAGVVRKSAFDIQHDAQGFVRVDTGFLKGTISTSFDGDGRFGKMVAEIGPTADYGIWQEIGTSVMAGQPYMAPAFDRREPEFRSALLALGVEVLR